MKDWLQLAESVLGLVWTCVRHPIAASRLTPLIIWCLVLHEPLQYWMARASGEAPKLETKWLRRRWAEQPFEVEVPLITDEDEEGV